MPQRSFWADVHEVRFTAEFALDPTTPGAPPWMALRVHDQAGDLVKARQLRVPPNYAEDAFTDVTRIAFDAWMASDAQGAMAAAYRHMGSWWAAEDERTFHS